MSHYSPTAVSWPTSKIHRSFSTPTMPTVCTLEGFSGSLWMNIESSMHGLQRLTLNEAPDGWLMFRLMRYTRSLYANIDWILLSVRMSKLIYTLYWFYNEFDGLFASLQLTVMAHIMCSDICLYLFITCQKLSEFIWIYVRMFGVGRIRGALSRRRPNTISQCLAIVRVWDNRREFRMR